jgi:hypothetical protein
MTKAADEITRLTAEVERLTAELRTAADMNAVYEGRLQEEEAEVERLRAAAPHIKELYAIITDQAAEIEKLRNDVRLAVMSDGEECKLLTHINEALIAAPTVDVDVIVPDRDYSQMTPKDCYEAGLLDGVYQAREAIKKASRAAIALALEEAAKVADDCPDSYWGQSIAAAIREMVKDGA